MPTHQRGKIHEIAVTFDGSNAGNASALVEFCRATFATNGPGTNSTSVTPGKRNPGDAETIQSTAAKNWTTEPTVLTAQQTLYVPQFNGVYHLIVPFTVPFKVIGGQGFVIRITASANVNCSGHITVEE
jgi:hypothetical protein